jgi:Tfp pilus assembly protein PilF
VKRALLLIVFSIFVFSGCSKNKDIRQQAAANNPYTELKQADQLLLQKQCPEAAASYKRFLEKYPKDAGGWNSLGIAYLCSQQPQDAISAFQQALTIAPTFTDVHNNMGIAYMEMKNYKDAKVHFMKALADPQYPTAGPYFNLAKLTFLEGSYEESRALAKKVLEFTPKETAPRLLYGVSLEKLGRYDEAATQYREVLKEAPDHVEACYHLGTVLMNQKKPCEAREFFAKVVDADPLGELGQKSITVLKGLQCTKRAN